jgi:hypothetical protein
MWWRMATLWLTKRPSAVRRDGVSPTGLTRLNAALLTTEGISMRHSWYGRPLHSSATMAPNEQPSGTP